MSLSRLHVVSYIFHVWLLVGRHECGRHITASYLYKRQIIRARLKYEDITCAVGNSHVIYYLMLSWQRSPITVRQSSTSVKPQGLAGASGHAPFVYLSCTIRRFYLDAVITSVMLGISTVIISKLYFVRQ